MKRLAPIFFAATLVLSAGCGDDDPVEPSANSSAANGATNSNPNGQANVAANAATNNGTTTDPVRVDCVSELVTAGGNYYAVSAEITGVAARVELINYLAATPTSDPVEESVWNDEVAAQFSPVAFAYQTDEHFLDVTKDEAEDFYRGTMSGENSFGDAVDVTCWPVDLEHAAAYDTESGECFDAAGEPAANDIPWMVALRTGFGQCTVFEGSLAGEATGATFDFIDLRGSDFSGATLRSAVVQEVELGGADLSQLTIESATISGTKDSFTLLPADGCQDDGDTFTCFN